MYTWSINAPYTGSINMEDFHKVTDFKTMPNKVQTRNARVVSYDRETWIRFTGVRGWDGNGILYKGEVNTVKCKFNIMLY